MLHDWTFHGFVPFSINLRLSVVFLALRDRCLPWALTPGIVETKSATEVQGGGLGVLRSWGLLELLKVSDLFLSLLRSCLGSSQ